MAGRHEVMLQVLHRLAGMAGYDVGGLAWETAALLELPVQFRLASPEVPAGRWCGRCVFWQQVDRGAGRGGMFYEGKCVDHTSRHGTDCCDGFEPMGCRHDSIVPNPDEEGDGRCEDCGEAGFPMTVEAAGGRRCGSCGHADYSGEGCDETDCPLRSGKVLPGAW